MDDMSVFKAFLRKLKRDLEELHGLLKEKDTDKALKEVERLLEDTERDLKD